MSPVPFPFTPHQIRQFICIAKRAWIIGEAKKQFNTDFPTEKQISEVIIPVQLWGDLDAIKDTMTIEAIRSIEDRDFTPADLN